MKIINDNRAANNAITVSYTHLDVYKRQASDEARNELKLAHA